MARCSLYILKDSYKIVTQSVSEFGFYISDEPVFILSRNEGTDILALKILECLNSSRYKVPFKTDKDSVEMFQRNHLKKLEEKSYNSLYKKMKLSLSILKKDDEIIVYKNKFFKPSRPSMGLDWDESTMKVITNQFQENLKYILDEYLAML